MENYTCLCIADTDCCFSIAVFIRFIFKPQIVFTAAGCIQIATICLKIPVVAISLKSDNSCGTSGDGVVVDGYPYWTKIILTTFGHSIGIVIIKTHQDDIVTNGKL